MKCFHKAEYKSVEKPEGPRQSILSITLLLKPNLCQSGESRVKSGKSWRWLLPSGSAKVSGQRRLWRFIAFLLLSWPEYDPPSQTTITKYIKQLYDEEKKDRWEPAGGDRVLLQASRTLMSTILTMRWRCLAVTENKEAHTAVNYRKKTLMMI